MFYISEGPFSSAGLGCCGANTQIRCKLNIGDVIGGKERNPWDVHSPELQVFSGAILLLLNFLGPG